MTLILDGRRVALERESSLQPVVSAWRERSGRVPCLATILVGTDPASTTYVRMKASACRRIGIEPLLVHLPGSTSTQQLLDQIQKLNEDPDVFGILLQHPVPPEIDERQCFDAIALEKDTDGVTTAGFGRMAMGLQAFSSATPTGIMSLLREYRLDLAGKHAVVLGRSPILGKPMAAMLLNVDATVTVCHSKTSDLKGIVARADILVAAVGKPRFVPGAWIPDRAIVVDAGYHPGGVGDIDAAGEDVRWSAYTPVPGGVGPMTISALLENTVQAMELRHA